MHQICTSLQWQPFLNMDQVVPQGNNFKQILRKDYVSCYSECLLRTFIYEAIFCLLHNTLTRLSVADLRGGARDVRPPGGRNSFNFMQFLWKFGEIVCWRPPPPGELEPLLGEILDPPLVVSVMPRSTHVSAVFSFRKCHFSLKVAQQKKIISFSKSIFLVFFVGKFSAVHRSFKHVLDFFAAKFLGWYLLFQFSDQCCRQYSISTVITKPKWHSHPWYRLIPYEIKSSAPIFLYQGTESIAFDKRICLFVHLASWKVKP